MPESPRICPVCKEKTEWSESKFVISYGMCSKCFNRPDETPSRNECPCKDSFFSREQICSNCGRQLDSFMNC